jgi:hypothetical protein
MPYTFRIKQNDLRPYLSVELVTDQDGTACDVTNATVVFSMATSIGSTPKIDEAAVTVIDAAQGQVQYRWQAGDTDTIANYYGEIEVTFSDSRPLTFPEKADDGTGGYIEIEVYGEIA